VSGTPIARWSMIILVARSCCTWHRLASGPTTCQVLCVFCAIFEAF
jgi:hypothetical protein